VNTQNCRIAALQMVSGPRVDDNLKAAARLVEEAVAQGAQLAVLPEYFPVIGAGLGGRLPIGTHVRYPGGTPIANLFVTLLNAIDVPTTTFGDAVGPLA
jgi:predicted amidohydrolase